MIIKITKNTIDNYIDSSIILYGFDNSSVLNLAISNPSTISNNALDVFDNASLNDVSFPTYAGFKTALIGFGFLEVAHLTYGFVTVNLLRIDKIEVIDSANTKIYFDRSNSLDVNVGSSTLQSAINTALLPPIADVIKFVSLSADVPTTSTTFADVTNLQLPVVAGEVYWFRMLINYTQGNTSAGCAFAINGPAITTLTYRAEWNNGTSRFYQECQSTYDGTAKSTGAPNKNFNLAIMEGFIQCSASGNVIARMATSMPSNTITVKANSIIQFKKIN